MDEGKIWGLNDYGVYANIVIMEAKWRKMRKGVLGGCVGVVVAVCLMVILSGGERVMALAGVGESKTICGDITNDASDKTKVYNPSLYVACTQRNTDKKTDYGAIWLGNMRKDSRDYLSAKVSTEIVDENGQMEVFLRGAVMGPNGAPASDNQSLTGSAQCIKIYVKRGGKTYKPFSFSNTVSDMIDGRCELKRGEQIVQTYEPNYILRRQANPDPFELDRNGNGIRFGGTRVYVDFSKLENTPWATIGKRDGGFIEFNEASVTIQRCFSTGRTYGTAEEKAACRAEDSVVKVYGNLMSAKSTVSGGGKTMSTGEVIQSTAFAGPLILDSCENGCDVTFTHEIKKKNSFQFNQKYYYRIKNGINRQPVVDSSLIEGTGEKTIEPGNMRYNKTVKLYPGEIYCSTMDYGIGKDLNDKGTIQSTSVCAAVKGKLNTAISLDVQRQEGSKLGITGIINESGTNSIYVQPGEFEVGSTVTTNVQKAYNLSLKRVAIDGDLLTPDLGKRNVTLANRVSEKLNWSNTAKVTMNGGIVLEKDYLAGTRCGNRDFDRSELGEGWTCSLPGKSVDFQGPGHTYELSGRVNASGDGSVPGSVEFENVSGVGGIYLRANIGTELVSNSLDVKVPYNFTNSTWVDGDGMKNIELGSDFDVEYFVNVGERKNEKLGGDPYATQVDNAKSGVDWCKIKKDIPVSSVIDLNACEGVKETVTYDADKDREGIQSETLSPGQHGRSVSIEREDLTNKGVQVGDIICAWSWVTPWNSWDDLQMSHTWGEDGNTANSLANEDLGDKRVCGQIGKSPTIQVWGGNVLSEGELKVSGVKNKDFKRDDETIKRYFGSFGELGVFVPNGATSNSDHFASGAALGYGGIHQWNDDSKNVLLPSYLGRNKEGSEEFGGGIEGGMGGLKFDFGGDSRIGNFEVALREKYCGDGASGCLSLGEVGTDFCEGKDYCRAEEETVIINHGKSVVIGGGNVEISTNVQYEDGSYDSFSEVPRFIVIAENIEIGCGVKRIDGLLVATGTVNTCKSEDQEDREKEDHSNQLIVNGAIIAGGLVANRTYGAGPWVYSIVPAEIVRFDPTLLDLDLGSNDSNPKIVNITELPPRY